MDKTSGAFLESWPVPISFAGLLSFKSFKECFLAKKPDETKRTQKSTEVKATPS